MHELNDPQRLEVSAHLVDARGEACPMPIVRLAKALHAHQRVEVWASDPAFIADVRAFVQARSLSLVALDAGKTTRAVIAVTRP